MDNVIKELEAFHQLAQVITVSIDREGKIRYINSHGSRLLGYKQEELINKDWFETCLPADSLPTLRPIYERFIVGETEAAEFYQNPILTRDGREKMISWHNMLRRNEQGAIIGSYSTGIDISALVEVGKREKALGEMLENALNEIYIVDADSLQILHVNKSAQANIGYRDNEWRNIGLQQFIQKEQREQFIHYLHTVSATNGHARLFESHFQRKDGSQYPVEVYLHRSYYRNAPALIVYAQDISQRKKAQTLLVASEAKYLTILNAAAEGILSINSREEVESFNKAAESLFGYRAEEVIGKSARLLVTPENHSYYQSLITQYLAGERDESKPIRAEMNAIRKDGSTFPIVFAVAEVVFDLETRFIVVIHDLSQIKQTELALRVRDEELQQLRQQLYHADRITQMNALASGIAHEINQPLSAINTYAETCQKVLALSKETTEDINHSLLKISEQAQRAGDVISFFREMTKKQPGKREIVDFNTLVKRTLEIMQQEFKKHQVVVTTDFTEALPTLNADPVQIQQVILNLLQNSVDSLKQSDNPEKHIDILTQALKNDKIGHKQRILNTMIKFIIRDNGGGIISRQHDDLFTPFTGSNNEGLGLGLAICRDIINNLGGKIEYSRSYTSGAEFYFTLPIST